MHQQEIKQKALSIHNRFQQMLCSKNYSISFRLTNFMKQTAVDVITFSHDWLTLSAALITVWININFQNLIIKTVNAKFTEY